MTEHERTEPFTAEEALDVARKDEMSACRVERDWPSDDLTDAELSRLRRRAATLRRYAELTAENARLAEEVERLERFVGERNDKIEDYQIRLQGMRGQRDQALAELSALKEE